MVNMENQELWQQCLQLIAEKVSAHVYDTWFKDITIDSYDAGRNAVVLTVPHRYVYEYIEEVHTVLMKQVLDATFKPGVVLGYRLPQKDVATPAVDFPSTPQIPQFSIPNARERLEKGLHHYLGDRAQWLPCYDQVVQWLTDNRGRGLLCLGTAGLGKTVICRDILPWILGKDKVTVVTAMEMGQRIDELLKARCVVVDGLGQEAVHEMVNYKRRTPFYELCDAAERNGILLIITTSLSTTPAPAEYRRIYPESIEERYGSDVLSRLRATTTTVAFTGPDLRK